MFKLALTYGNNRNTMKHTLFILLFSVTLAPLLRAQSDKQRKDITSLINKYSEAREKRDTVLLKNILTPDVDQLVSTGEWRNGIDASVKGMLNSSVSAPGTRTLTVEKIRMLNPDIAIVDCKYEITDTGGTARKMWSTFVIVLSKGVWKISAIRNMLPAGQTP